MVLSIKDPDADRLARLAREEQKSDEVESKVADAMEIGRHHVSQPLVDDRSPEEMPDSMPKCAISAMTERVLWMRPDRVTAA